MYTGTDVSMFAKSAIMGATTPKTRVAIETSPFPVPRSLAGKISGEAAYKTPYIIYLSKGKMTISLHRLKCRLKTYVAAEGVSTIPAKKRVGVPCRCGSEQENRRRDCQVSFVRSCRRNVNT